MSRLKFFNLILVILVLIPISYSFSNDNYIKLLAVVDTPNQTYHGTIATMNLKLIPGTGNVFFDSSSLTQVDTQISIKIAKEIACGYVDINCNQYDFLYQINANSDIIGGPSAGAAATVLTISSLLNVSLNKSISMTGTINSAGFIGNVGGVRQKVIAASQNKITRVLIPYDNENYSNISILVNKIYSLDEALYYFTNKKLGHKNENITFDDTLLLDSYNKRMKIVSSYICNRTNYLQNLTNSSKTKMQNLSLQLLIQHNYYSAASYCFRANIDYQFKYLNQSKHNSSNYYSLINKQYLEKLNDVNNKKIRSLNDLQVIFIIKDRLNDLKDNLKLINESTNLTNDQMLSSYAYSFERLNTIDAWSKFYSNKTYDNLTNINDKLKILCQDKIREAKNRLDYFKFILPNTYYSLKFNKLEKEFVANDPIDCINKATFIKSRTDVILSSIGNNDTNKFYEIKRNFAAKMLKSNFDKNILPIMGYSYYQYASSLHNQNNTIEALTYLENAIDSSSINDILYKKTNVVNITSKVNNDANGTIFSLNRVIGVLILVLCLEFYMCLRIFFIIKKNKKQIKYFKPQFNDLKKKIKKI